MLTTISAEANTAAAATDGAAKRVGSDGVYETLNGAVMPQASSTEKADSSMTRLAATAAAAEVARRTTIALDQYQRLQLYNYALSIEQRLRLPPPTLLPAPSSLTATATPTITLQHAAAMAAATAYARSSAITAVGSSGTTASTVSETRAYSYTLPMLENSRVHVYGGHSQGGSQQQAHTQRLALSMSLFRPHIFQPEEPKPQHSYIGLIAMAILGSAETKLVLSDIYQYILDNYPYFRSRGPGWRNSIRHNLSLNDCFIKSGRSANGKGHYWAIHPANMEDFRKGDFRRRKAQRKVRKHMGLAVDDAGSETPSPPPLTPSYELIGGVGATTTTTTMTTVNGQAAAAASARSALRNGGHYQLYSHPVAVPPMHLQLQQLQQQQHQRNAYITAQQLHTNAFSYLVQHQQQQHQHGMYLQQQKQLHQQQQQHGNEDDAEKQQNFFATSEAATLAIKQHQQQLHYSNNEMKQYQPHESNMSAFAVIRAESTTTRTTATTANSDQLTNASATTGAVPAIDNTNKRGATPLPLTTAELVVAQLSQTRKRRQFDVASLLAPDVRLISVEQQPLQKQQLPYQQRQRHCGETKVLLVDVECVDDCDDVNVVSNEGSATVASDELKAECDDGDVDVVALVVNTLNKSNMNNNNSNNKNKTGAIVASDDDDDDNGSERLSQVQSGRTNDRIVIENYANIGEHAQHNDEASDEVVAFDKQHYIDNINNRCHHRSFNNGGFDDGHQLEDASNYSNEMMLIATTTTTTNTNVSEDHEFVEVTGETHELTEIGEKAVGEIGASGDENDENDDNNCNQSQEDLQLITTKTAVCNVANCNNGEATGHCSKSQKTTTTACLDAQHILAGYYGTYMSAASARRRCVNGNYFALLQQQQEHQQQQHHPQHQQQQHPQQQQEQHYHQQQHDSQRQQQQLVEAHLQQQQHSHYYYLQQKQQQQQPQQ